MSSSLRLHCRRSDPPSSSRRAPAIVVETRPRRRHTVIETRPSSRRRGSDPGVVAPSSTRPRSLSSSSRPILNSTQHLTSERIPSALRNRRATRDSAGHEKSKVRVGLHASRQMKTKPAHEMTLDLRRARLETIHIVARDARGMRIIGQRANVSAERVKTRMFEQLHDRHAAAKCLCGSQRS